MVKKVGKVSIEIFHIPTDSGNSVGKGYWSADCKYGGSHELIVRSALHAIHLEF